MDGMGMLLKSFGLDPEEIKEGIKKLILTVQEVDARLTRIENAIDAIAERQIQSGGEFEQAGIGATEAAVTGTGG